MKIQLNPGEELTISFVGIDWQVSIGWDSGEDMIYVREHKPPGEGAYEPRLIYAAKAAYACPTCGGTETQFLHAKQKLICVECGGDIEKRDKL